MRKADLVTAISEKTGVPKVDVLVTLETFFKEVKGSLAEGENVYIRGFGSFIMKKRAKKIGRHIKKNVAIEIPEHFIPAFKPAKIFVEQVKDNVSSLPNEEDEGPPPDSPEAIRAAWENRGGVKATYGIRAMMTGLLIPDVQYIDRNPVSTELEVGKKNTYGIGGGIGAHVSFLFMPLPKPGEGKGWQGFRIGAGLDLNVLYVRPPVGYTYHLSNNQLSSRDTQYENKAFLYAIVPLQLGVQFGLGDFRATNLWRGVALGLAYSPAVITTLEIGQNQDKAQTNFNYGGVELDLDITKLESAENANSQIRLFAMLLPKVNDKVPWLASAGIGAVWY